MTLQMEMPKDRILQSAYSSGHYEPFESRLVLSYLRNGDVAIDVGANVGYYSLLCSKKVGETGKVYSFEPDESNFETLVRNLNINNCKNVSPFMVAVGSVNGRVGFYENKVNSGDCRVWVLGRSNEAPDIIKRQVTLDSVIKRIPNLIKIDVQGWETSVLSGSRNLIRSLRSLALAIEFWPWGLRGASSSPEEFLDLLFSFGFLVFFIKEDTLVQVDESQLLDLVDPATDHFVNLWCLK